MRSFAVYYIFVNILCTLIFGVLLFYNRHNIDRQEKQMKFDYALIAFMLYFITDCFWAAIITEMLPKTLFSMALNEFLIYIFMAAIIYYWLDYVLAVEHVPGRNEPRRRILTLLPFLITTVIMVVNYIIAPKSLITDTFETTPLYEIYLSTVPGIYLIVIFFYTIRWSKNAESPTEKKEHLFVGLLPLITLILALSQSLFFPELPIYCSASVILMLIFYIRSINNQVSVDPLTGLNNRGQLMRYTSQKSNMYMENRRTILIMMDINMFKMINDTYGHAEGDKALVILADALKKVINNYKMPSFIGRYGGDEFIVIIHPDSKEDHLPLIDSIRTELADTLQKAGTAYDLSVSLGYEPLAGEGDTFQNCLQRADENLYADKKHSKSRSSSSRNAF